MQLKRKLSHFNLMIYVAWQVSKRLLRDKRTLGLVLLGPIFYVFIFGYGFAGEIKHQPIEIINLDQKATRTIPFVNRKLELDIGTQLVNELKNDDRVSIKNVYTQENWTSTTFENAKQKVLDKKIKAVILIPENYSKEILNSIIYQENVTEAVILYLDNSNPQVGSIILQAFREAFQKALGQFQESLNFSIEYGYGENLTQLEYFSPIVIALGTFVFSLILALVNIIEERRSGTLDLLLQFPHDKSQIIFGYMIPFAVVASLQTIVIITVSALLFDVNYGSQLPSLFVAAILMSFTSLSLGIFLSTFAKTELQAIQFVPIVLFPAIFLSGVILPLESIPEYIRWFSFLIPLTYGIELLRTIIIEQRPLDIFSTPFLALIVFITVFIVLSRVTLRES